jgi:hypothetical protein
MQYAILINETPHQFADRNNGNAEAYWAGWKAYTEAMAEAGIVDGGKALQAPESGTSIRLVGGERQVQDGPFVETKEGLGGFIIIDVPDLDTALDWAARCPAADGGSVEVRPVLAIDG